MGKNTNQIATCSDLYERGHTYLGKSNKCVTYKIMYENSTYHSGYGGGFWSGSTLPMDSNGTSLTVDENKCVIFKDFASKMVRQPWYLKIIEKVGGSTRANSIELRYYYRLTSSSAETYVSAGKWTNSGNINDSASATHYFEANPYCLYNANVYDGYLAIWFGEANLKQHIYYKLRTKSTIDGKNGSWGNSVYMGESKSTLIPINKVTGKNTFLTSMDKYNGIEITISKSKL